MKNEKKKYDKRKMRTWEKKDERKREWKNDKYK